jgi:hypothetical protein
MRVWILIAAFLAPPFWETLPPEDWTVQQAQLLLSDSPWAGQTSEGLTAYVASALPMQQAEEQLLKKRKRNQDGEASLPQDYIDYREESKGKVVILALQLKSWAGLSEVKESERMERDTVMVSGGKRIRMNGHFPPTPSDPYLRFIFPRAAKPNQKVLRFEVYIPGDLMPFQEIDFDMRRMIYRGNLEF